MLLFEFEALHQKSIGFLDFIFYLHTEQMYATLSEHRFAKTVFCFAYLCDNIKSGAGFLDGRKRYNREDA